MLTVVLPKGVVPAAVDDDTRSPPASTFVGPVSNPAFDELPSTSNVPAPAFVSPKPGAADGPTPHQIGQWQPFWHMMFEPFRGLFDSPLSQKLEDEGIFSLLEEDSRVKTDYSFYKDL